MINLLLINHIPIVSHKKAINKAITICTMIDVEKVTAKNWTDINELKEAK